MKSKNQLRKQLKLIRDNISSDVRKTEEEIIINTILNSEIYKKSKSIFIYNSFRSEVDTTCIIDNAMDGLKIVAIPVTNSHDNSMEAYIINKESKFIEDSYGISIPDKSNSNIINPQEIDLAIVPLIAYDNTGNRLGYGGGYYDRYLPKLRADAFVVGLAFSNQLVENLPFEEHDNKLDYIITVKYIENKPFGNIIVF